MIRSTRILRPAAVATHRVGQGIHLTCVFLLGLIWCHASANPCLNPPESAVRSHDQAGTSERTFWSELSQTLRVGTGWSGVAENSPETLVVRFDEAFVERELTGDRRGLALQRFRRRHGIVALRPLLRGEDAERILARLDVAYRRRGDALRVNRARLVDLRRRLGRVHVLTVDAPAVGDRHDHLRRVLAGLRSDPSVEHATTDAMVHAAVLPDDPLFSSSNSWGQGPQIRDLWGLVAIGAPAAWDAYPSAVADEDVVVAVLDTGIDFFHPDLVGNAFTRPDNCLDEDANGYVGDIFGWDFTADAPLDRGEDFLGHGTHVAGTIAARGNNGVGMTGVAWNAKIMAVKVLSDSGRGRLSWTAAGIVYAAENGADVINMSLATAGYVEDNSVLIDAVAYARLLGVVSVAAAGNFAADIGTQRRGVMPAALDDVVAVGASDELDRRANFSNGGAGLSVVAPGAMTPRDDVPLSQFGIVSARSRWVADTWPGLRVVLGPDDQYLRLAGTSMAAPHVSGVAALVAAWRPDLPPGLVRLALEDAAEDLGTLGFDVFHGHGRVDAPRTLARATEMTAVRLPELELTEVGGPTELLHTARPTFVARFRNVGLERATDVPVTLFVDGEPSDEVRVPFVAAGEERAVELTTGFPAPGSYRLRFVVNDPARPDALAEYRSSNNERGLEVDARTALFHPRFVTDPVYKWPREGLSACAGQFVWAQQRRSGRRSIWGYFWHGDDLRDQGDGEPVLISRPPRNDFAPACDGNLIVWSHFDYMTSESRLMMQRTAMGPTGAVAPVGDPLPVPGTDGIPSAPALQRDRLIWLDSSQGHHRLLLLDLGARTPRDGLAGPHELTRDVDAESFPAVSGREVVWSRSVEGGRRAVFKLVLLPDSSRLPIPSRNGEPQGRRPVGVPLRLSPDFHDARDPQIDRGHVVWVDETGGLDSVWLWTPGTGPVPIALGQVNNDDGDFTVHRAPAIHGSLIVWVSNVHQADGDLVLSRLWVKDAGPDGRWNNADDYGTFLVHEIDTGSLDEPVVHGNVIGAFSQVWFHEPPFVLGFTYERAVDF